MYLKNTRKSKSIRYEFKKLLLFLGIAMSIVSQSSGISEPLINSKFNELNQYSKESFITKAVEKTGTSVVTIETQKYIKKRQFPKDSPLFLDPYFERFFGLYPPSDNQPRVEQSQGSGFIFTDSLVMTNAHVINGSDKVIIGLTNGKS